jgi:hypothetical protein
MPYSLAEAKASADRVQHISDEIAKLQEAKKTLGDTLAIEEQLRDSGEAAPSALQRTKR